jgi:hypothetical protein
MRCGAKSENLTFQYEPKRKTICEERDRKKSFLALEIENMWHIGF